MIKENELRIGNWYLGASRLQPTQATGKMIAQLEEGILNASPIHLTPETLEKIGFEKYGSDRLHHKAIKLLIKLGRIDKGAIYVVNGNGFICSVKYLHELQNVISAIERKELEITL